MVYSGESIYQVLTHYMKVVSQIRGVNLHLLNTGVSKHSAEIAESRLRSSINSKRGTDENIVKKINIKHFYIFSKIDRDHKIKIDIINKLDNILKKHTFTKPCNDLKNNECCYQATTDPYEKKVKGNRLSPERASIGVKSKFSCNVLLSGNVKLTTEMKGKIIKCFTEAVDDAQIGQVVVTPLEPKNLNKLNPGSPYPQEVPLEYASLPRYKLSEENLYKSVPKTIENFIKNINELFTELKSQNTRRIARKPIKKKLATKITKPKKKVKRKVYRGVNGGLYTLHKSKTTNKFYKKYIK